MKFDLLTTDGGARRGQLTLAHGTIQTPVFMPVGTYGTVKAMSPAELTEIGFEMVLSNTFHLWLRPGLEVIEKFGGLHRFMGWDKPILTDSGGFQVFSLGKLRKITEEGVKFSSPINGDKLFLTPEISMQIQRTLNSDIVMIFDECTPYPSSEREAADSMRMSLRWAERSKTAHAGNPNALYGIVQGGMYESLRDESVRELDGMDFDGYAIGGLKCRRTQGRHGAHSQAHRAAVAGRQTTLPDGRGHAVRSGIRGEPGHRPVRLRAAHPQCPPRHPLHPTRRHAHPQCTLENRHRADR